MKKILIISVIVNILFCLFSGYVIHKKGGINYLKREFNIQTFAIAQQEYGEHYKVRMSIFEIMPKDTNDIIFLGNSLTEGCDWSGLFSNVNIKNRGITGDLINGVIDRLDEIIKSKPKKIFLMIGINDLARKSKVKQILTDYERLINLIKNELPRTQLYIQSILPTNNRENLHINDIMAINKGLTDLTIKYNLKYVNLFDLLQNDENKLDTVYTYDGLHLYGKGYIVWKKAIENYVNN